MNNLLFLAMTQPLVFADGQTERDAVLLEVCDLPDKDLTLSEADLDGIVARFTPDCPVKVEHVDSPLDPLGWVKRVWRDGTRLMGRIAFPAGLADFIRERGAVKLSCGLSREPLDLKEVSLVAKPRLAAATLLSDNERAELVRLRQQVLDQQVDAQITQLKAQGRLLPATESLARRLLSAPPEARIVLSDGTGQTVAETFLAFLQAQPPRVILSELAPSGPAASANPALTDAETAFYRDRLGLDPARVAAQRQKEATHASG